MPELNLPEELVDANLSSLTEEELKILDKQTQYAIRLLRKNGLLDAETGRVSREITPTILMDDQYPGALVNGEIYGAFEAENDIPVPRGPGGCPGHGELCYIDYRHITRRMLTGQLEAIGISPDKIEYFDDQAIDPASRDNDLASNRLFQLAGVAANKTPRTASGVRIAFRPRGQQ